MLTTLIFVAYVKQLKSISPGFFLKLFLLLENKFVTLKIKVVNQNLTSQKCKTKWVLVLCFGNQCYLKIQLSWVFSGFFPDFSPVFPGFSPDFSGFSKFLKDLYICYCQADFLYTNSYFSKVVLARKFKYLHFSAFKTNFQIFRF